MTSAELGLLKCPVDMLLCILSFCNLQDSLSFLLVCKDTHALSAQKAFWITTLKNERQIRPIACPYHEDIATLDLHHLKRIALHTRRLDRNWNSEKPQVVGRIKTMTLLLPTFNILFQVPGTELCVLHCLMRGTVELWHTGSESLVSGPFRISTEVCDISQAEDLPGKLTMALLVRNFEDDQRSFRIALLSIEYGPDVVSMTIPLLFELPTESLPFYWAVFLDNDIVGALCCRRNDMKLCLFARNRRSGKDSFITTNLPCEESPVHIFDSGTTIVDGNLCIVIDGFWVFTVPKGHLPRDENPECPSMSIFNFDDNFSHFPPPFRTDDNNSFLSIMTASSPYGVSAMSVNKVTPQDDPDSLEVTFWVQPESTREKQPPLTPVTSFCMADAMDCSRLVQTLSGRRGLMLLNVKDEADDNSQGTPVLRLVSCERHAKAKFQDLALPDFINLRDVHGIFLDDHLGVVSLMAGGLLYSIPYA